MEPRILAIIFMFFIILLQIGLFLGKMNGAKISIMGMFAPTIIIICGLTIGFVVMIFSAFLPVILLIIGGLILVAIPLLIIGIMIKYFISGIIYQLKK